MMSIFPSKIEAFLTRHGMPATVFGELAMNDGGFVRRAGGNLDARLSPLPDPGAAQEGRGAGGRCP